MIKIITLFMSLAYLSSVFAQWQTDLRLTNDTATSYTSENNARCIAASGNNIHIIWIDSRGGDWELYYKRSTDGGSTWGTDIRLTNSIGYSAHPSIAVSGSFVYAVWDDSRNGGNVVYFKRSTNAGVSWESDFRLTFATNYSYYPSLSVSGSNVYVAWIDMRDGNNEIYYKNSTDAGISWSTDLRLTNNSGSSVYPTIQSAGSVIHVSWWDNRDGNYEIYYKRSPDGGLSWGQDIRLTNNSSTSMNSCISASGFLVHVVWYDNRDGNYEIYNKFSADGGINWSQDIRLTNSSGDSWHPFVTLSGSIVHVTWEDYRDGNFEIYYKRSTDGGLNWGTDTRLTNSSAVSQNSSIDISGSVLHVVWLDNRDGNYEIYYKRNPTGNQVGVKSIESEIPKEFELHQNYPNPFNPVSKIRFDLPKSYFVIVAIFDILGREVAALVNEQLEPGTYEVDWNAADYPSGIYYYTIKTTAFSQTKKMVLIK